MPNALINETSPYLLQHAHNPVNWYPWGPEALRRAREENKLIIVSIGYSACHWCHVMEHESFEDEQVAALMNERFISIKVDREERPDIDQVYMYAVQLMTGSGGWPLNCICLPDQRPFYGGTYFRPGDWKNLLVQLADFWKEKPNETVDYAVRLTEGIRSSELPIADLGDTRRTEHDVHALFETWKGLFDEEEGGYARAPKFPLPNNWVTLLRYAHFAKSESAVAISRITLRKMAFGGIYDHLGGGFARYSVDDKWHVPHFEKMLYDNAQLVSLYAEAFQHDKDPVYREIVYETIAWLKREMTSPEGGFYAALDADSEGVEGKFYTFTKAEIALILGDDEPVFSAFFQVTDEGNWTEEHTNVLFRKGGYEEMAALTGTSAGQLEDVISRGRKKLFAYRENRIRPALDNKQIASWNGLMLKGLVDAYRVFNEPAFLELALDNARFIEKRLTCSDGGLKRLAGTSDHGKADKGSAFLDDYAFIIDAFLAVYEATFDEHWLTRAYELTAYTQAHFFDQQSGVFFYTSSSDEALIARKYELMDNVIPSSNSVMAHNLFRLGHFYDEHRFLAMASSMLNVVMAKAQKYPSSYSHWVGLLLFEVYGIFEVGITGPGWPELRAEFDKYYVPGKILFGGNKGTLPLLSDKIGSTSRIFVCRNRTCQLPVYSVDEAIKQLNL